MTFDLESQPMPFTKIDDTSVLTWANKDPRSVRRKLRQQRPRVAITAMLRPHNPEHAELSTIRMPTQTADDLVVILTGESLLLDLGRNG